MSKRKPRGLTLVELMVTLLIAVILGALAYDALQQSRPRASLNETAAELMSAIHSARQSALANGTNFAVLLFPTYASSQGTGRFVVLEDEPVGDGNPSFFSTAAPLNFANYDPTALGATPTGGVITTFDLPPQVLVGPAVGMGFLLPFPYNAIPTNVDCSFCGAGGDRRGAIVFDDRGRASFCSAPGPTTISCTTVTAGQSFTLYETDLLSGATYTTQTLVITAPQGVVRTFENG